MRVAVVHSFYTAQQPSGENNVVLDQVEQLRNSGHDVRLIARHTDDLAQEPLYSVRAAMATATGIGPSPDDALSEFEPDVVHVHNTFPNWGTAWLRRWSDRTVMTAHNFRPMCSASTLFRDGHYCVDCLRVPALPAVRYGCYRGSSAASVPLAIASTPVGPLRRAIRRVSRVVTLNEHARTVYQQVLRRPIDLIPNFVEPAEFFRTPTRGWAYIGRLTREKGIDGMIESWPAGEPLEVIGHGPLADEVTQLAAGNPDITLSGLVPRDQLLERLGTYKGLLLPSLWTEGLPTIVLEGLARGVPAIVSRHVSASGFLERSGAAKVFDPEKGAHELSAALAAIRKGAERMRHTCVELHEREYSPRVWQERIDSLYAEVSGVGARAT